MLYIMRHGITDWNKARKLQGRTDIPLNDEGRAMARAAAEEYRDLRLDVCYCSPLKRARETAEILLKGRDVPIIPDDRLMEMGFGEYEGLADSYKIPDCPINLLFQSPEKYKKSIGGAETFDELFARTGSFLKEIAEPLLEQGKDVLIVGHGAMNSCIIVQRKHLPIEKYWSNGIPQCKIMEI
ncbi:MAG: histidine phosphatase family protein [Lachnospiraceae bacterium]|nr:histidine phosphatase family protein [Lachnospiraceae bacterium]